MLNGFAAKILEWFAANGRDLPWRHTKDAYAIWLSEVILQQTRIQQGEAYWLRFMRRWPTVEALAAATEDEVLRMWQGLGYYSRARNLLTAARQVVEMGGFPQTTEGLQRLKGVGDYTAAAIASIAFDKAAAVVDGNVYRVLARHFGIDTPVNSTEGKKTFAKLADELLPRKEAAAYNQGMMDFGAMVCTPATPHCEGCVLAESCVALSTGRTTALPVKVKRTAVKERHLRYFYIRWKGMTAIHRRPAGDIWQGLWEPFVTEDDGMPDWLGPDCQVSVIAEGVKHVLTHRILTADCYLVETDTKPALPDGFVWIDEANIDDYGIPRLVEKLLEIEN